MKHHRIHKPGVRSSAMSSKLGLAALIIVAGGAVAPVVQTTPAQTPAPVTPDHECCGTGHVDRPKTSAGAWTFYARISARVRSRSS